MFCAQYAYIFKNLQQLRKQQNKIPDMSQY